MMAMIKGVDSISAVLKRQFENVRSVDEEESQAKTSLDKRLFSNASRVLETKIEFELSQVQSFTVLAGLKGKYKLLLAPKRVAVDKVSTSCSKIFDKRSESEGSPRKVCVKPSVQDSSNFQSPKVVLFPENAVRLGWQGNEPVGAGMINLGNTCYLNSTLQALFHIPSFCNWLKSETQHNGIGKCDQAFISGDMCLICAMASTLRIAQNHTGNVMKPVLIYGRLKSICKHLSHGHQEDAHEFLRFLIEGMERCFLLRYKGKKLDNPSKETTPLHRIFGGYLRNEVVCHSCGTTSTTFQLFQDLYLDIRHNDSLMDSMKAFFSRERLEGDDRNDSYRCEACKRKGNCSKRVYVQTPPKVLCLQLKRFTAMGKKIMKHISYPLKLDLSPYIYMKTLIRNGDVISPLAKARRPIPYKLVSLVTHYGSAMTCGHYTAVGRSAKGSYFTFDDSLVRPASLTSALGACAYILMYEMEPGWNVGLETNNGDKLNNVSLRPSKSLSELSELRRPQVPLPKLKDQLERKANSLLVETASQHSKAVQGNVASSTLEGLKPKSEKSSSSSEGIRIIHPAVSKPEAVASASASMSVKGKNVLNGSWNKVIGDSPSKLLSSSPLKKIVGCDIVGPSLSKSQDTSKVIKSQVPLSSEEKVKKDPNEVLKECDSASQKEPGLKNPRLSSSSFCDSVKKKSDHKETKQKPIKELTNDHKKIIARKRKHSSPCLEDEHKSPFPLKKQLTLPDLLSRKKSNCGAVETPRTKIKTLKDWLDIRSVSKGEEMINKGIRHPRMLPQVQPVISTVGGWKVTDHNSVSSNPVSDSKCNTVGVKRKKEPVNSEENKKKKLEQSSNVQLWRTFFKDKFLNSNLNKKELHGSKKNKQKEKGESDYASKIPETDESLTLFQRV